jgi:hypothetical protein
MIMLVAGRERHQSFWPQIFERLLSDPSLWFNASRATSILNHLNLMTAKDNLSQIPYFQLVFDYLLSIILLSQLHVGMTIQYLGSACLDSHIAAPTVIKLT